MGGTRPEAVKLAPVIKAVRARGGATMLVASGQHPLLFDRTLAAFGLAADTRLDVLADAHCPADVLGRLVPALSQMIILERPAAVVVQGDTTSALAALCRRSPCACRSRAAHAPAQPFS